MFLIDGVVIVTLLIALATASAVVFVVASFVRAAPVIAGRTGKSRLLAIVIPNGHGPRLAPRYVMSGPKARGLVRGGVLQPAFRIEHRK
jgi:hypothetical protein